MGVTEETIRTRVINTTRDHWKAVLHFASWALAALVTVSVAIGHKQADNATLATDVATLKTDMQGLKSSVASTNVSLARIEGTLNGINMKTDEFGKFKDGVQQGAKEALAIPVPKGHRAKK